MMSAMLDLLSSDRLVYCLGALSILSIVVVLILLWHL